MLFRRGRPLSAGFAEWLLDNYYLVEEQIDHIRLNLPPEYSQKLPRLGTGRRRGFPRCMDLSTRSSMAYGPDGRVFDIKSIEGYLRTYQSVRPAETWGTVGDAFDDRSGSYRESATCIIPHSMAETTSKLGTGMVWAFIEIIQKEPKSLITVLSICAFLIRLCLLPFLQVTADLQGPAPVASGLVINWVEQELAEHGQSLELIQQAGGVNLAADNACYRQQHRWFKESLAR